MVKEKIKNDDKELAKHMINPCFFIDRNLKVRFELNLDSHNLHHANSKLTITLNLPEFGIEVRFIKKFTKELSFIYAILINQYEFKYQTVFSARFDKQDEDNQVLDETESIINLNIIHNLTETDIVNTDNKSPLEHQIQHQETKDSGWRFDKFNSMIVYFYKSGELNGSSFVKFLLRSNAILNIKKRDKYRFSWSVLAYLHPCYKNHPNRVSNYKHYFNELNIDAFDFTNGLRCNHVHIFEKLNNLSINIFELNFYQGQKKWSHKLISIEVS